MKSSIQRVLSYAAVVLTMVFALAMFFETKDFTRISAQEPATTPTATPEPEFDQKAAIAKIRESIKGRENEPAGKVFKNVKDFAQIPAGRLLAVMEFGYARSLGVDCTHCHTPENWASDSMTEKRTARAMRAMVNRINGELLPSVEAFKNRTGRDRAVVNCTTCHRGAVIPATNLGR